ncbi:MAG: polyphenol oxidase family protein, partial [Nitrospirota bacterium]|nr:polyphenol oxidase family protein [Nitrospirota bacterium]
MYITPPNLDSSELKAFFTTRTLTDGKEHHISDALADELGVPKGDIFMPSQKHTGSVHVLGPDPAPVVADAVVTSRKNVFIGVLVADCVPVLLYDPAKEVAGAVHAGWRGTAQRILMNTIRTMHEKFLCSASDILVAIGPSIKQCSYEVGEE